MTRPNHDDELLALYVSGKLDQEQRQAVRDHLDTCVECRAELALWSSVGEVIAEMDASLPAPAPRVLRNVLTGVGDARPGSIRQAWQLLGAQLPLVRREIWSTSALVMIIGYVVALIVGSSGRSGRSGTVLVAVAPLIAAAGISMIYGRDNDPALELALATPTSPRQVLVARMVLVFGYDLLLALAASVGLLVVLPPGLLGSVILQWLGPMTFLSALALLLSLRIGTDGAITVVLVAWLSRWIMGSLATELALSRDYGQSLTSLAQAYAGLWSNSLLLAALAVLLGAVALNLVGRGEARLIYGRPVE